MQEQLLIYTPTITPRVKYVFSLFFETLINTPYNLTTDTAEYKNHQGAKINYSNQPIEEGEIFISANSLLFEDDIRSQVITVTEWEKLKIFYQADAGVLPFDLFAASFYLVSRYEEYLLSSLDDHDRFRHTGSLAFKNKFIDVPIVNLWANKLKDILKKKYPELEIKENNYVFTPTIDIDVAYAHKGRKLKIILGSYFRALFRLDFSYAIDKKLTLLGLKKDNFDTYNYQRDIFKKFNVRPVYFFLAGNWGKHDRNINTEGKYFQALVKKVSEYAYIGIHPSYRSGGSVAIVEQEIKRVEKNLTEKITKSRQHFLKITLPETYRCLAELGITDDYTMVFAACPGFRASICTPFFFYDLRRETPLPVKLHPTVFMEGTFSEYMQVKPEEAIVITRELIERVKQCKGEFVSIWHNDTLNNKGKWKGWRKVFEAMLETGTK